jgi:hypothetical protein
VVLKRGLKVLAVGMILWSLTLLLPGGNVAALFVIQAALAFTLGVVLAVVLFFQNRLAERAERQARPVVITS